MLAGLPYAISKEIPLGVSSCSMRDIQTYDTYKIYYNSERDNKVFTEIRIIYLLENKTNRYIVAGDCGKGLRFPGTSLHDIYKGSSIIEKATSSINDMLLEGELNDTLRPIYQYKKDLQLYIAMAASLKDSINYRDYSYKQLVNKYAKLTSYTKVFVDYEFSTPTWLNRSSI